MEDNFFVIDPDNVESVQTCLYGWCIAGGQIVTDAKDLEDRELSPEGCYVYVERSGKSVTLRQDAVGCYGLYLFREDDYWALSNSFLCLIDHVKALHRISFNKEYADQLLALGLCSQAYEDTLVKEIVYLDRSAELAVDVESGKLEITLRDYAENSVDLDSEEGMHLLDFWYSKWTGIIRDLKRQTNNMEFDLSGGFDTREILNLFLGSGIDLNEVSVNSSTDGLHTHADDYRIASGIADFYHFSLNDKERLSQGLVYYSLEDALNSSFYVKLGFHKQMYWPLRRRRDYLFRFTGGGGGCIRGHWAIEAKGSRDKLLHDFAGRCELYLQDGAEMSRSVRRIHQRAFDDICGKFESLGHGDRSGDVAFTDLYREGRCRNHFGKAKVESFFGGDITLTPLLDSDLQKLKLCSEECPDQDLLMAVMLDRFGHQELLGFEYEGGRSFAPETLVYARTLDERFPVNIPSGSSGGSLTLPAGLDLPEREQDNEPASAQALCDLVKDAFYSPEVKSAFEMPYSSDTYYQQATSFGKSYHPESDALGVLAVAEVLLDCAASGSASEGPTVTDRVMRQARATAHELRPEEMAWSPLYLENYVAARIDVKNLGEAENDLEIFAVSDHKTIVRSPQWFSEDGRGYRLTSLKGGLSLRLRCRGDGILRIVLRGRDVRDEDGRRIPFWIEFTDMEMDGEPVFDGTKPVWHDRPFILQRKVKDGEEISFFFAWRPYHDDGGEVERLRKEKGRLEAENSRLRDEGKQLEARLCEESEQLSKVKQSRSYKIGRAVTYFPRKVKQAFK